MILAFTVLGGRVIFLGLERIIVKKLGTGADGVSTAFIVLGLSAIFLSFFAIAPDMQFYPGLWLSPVSGLLYSIAYILYSRALSTGEVSLVSPLFNFNLLFLIFLTYIFLDEPVTLLKIVGILLMVYGISFLNRQRNILLSLRAVLYDHACRMMFTSSLLIAFGRVIDGYSMRDISPCSLRFFRGCSFNNIFIFVPHSPKKTSECCNAVSEKTGPLTHCRYNFSMFVFMPAVRIYKNAGQHCGARIHVERDSYRYFSKDCIKREHSRENDRRRYVIMLAGTWLLFA